MTCLNYLKLFMLCGKLIRIVAWILYGLPNVNCSREVIALGVCYSRLLSHLINALQIMIRAGIDLIIEGGVCCLNTVSFSEECAPDF